MAGLVLRHAMIGALRGTAAEAPDPPFRTTGA
jgi:hypothetical protein